MHCVKNDDSYDIVEDCVDWWQGRNNTVATFFIFFSTRFSPNQRWQLENSNNFLSRSQKQAGIEN